MPTTVNIIIKGIALCYQKDGMWKVLFPFDDCHSIKFSYRKDDAPLVKKGHLAIAKNTIEIAAPTAITQTKALPNFEPYILDLTSKNEKRKTHPKIKQKDEWRGKGVLMTVQNAEFSVYDYIQDYTDEEIYLVDSLGEIDPQLLEEPLVHWVKAEIKLNEGEVIVKSDGKEILKTEAGSSYTLIFDNDCQEIEREQHDMDMLYNLVVEPKEKPEDKKDKRKFRVGSLSSFSTRAVAGRKTFTDPPNLGDRKPCLVVRVSDSNDLP